MENLLKEITDELIAANKITCMQMMTEKSMPPCMLVRYQDDTEKTIRGIEDITKFLEKLINKQ